MIGSNIHYFYYPLEHCFRKLAEIGYREMELYLGTPHVFVDRSVCESFADIGRLQNEYGIRITSVHPETISFRYNLCSPDDEWRNRSIAAYCGAIDFAEKHGIGRLNTEINGVFRDLPRAETEERVLAAMEEILAYGQQRGVTIALETESRTFQGFLTERGELERFASRLTVPPAVTLNCDAAAEAGESMEDWFRTFGDRISLIRFGAGERIREIRDAAAANGYRGEYLYYPTDDQYWDEPNAADRAMIGGAG